MDLQDLLERVERARGPDRELDVAIAERLYPEICTPSRRGSHHDEPVWQTRDGLVRCECYTASVDAALALIEKVLPGLWWNVGICSANPLTYSADLADGTERPGATPALALCAALLAALIEQENTNG